MDEVTWAIGRLGDKRSPGSDGIPALILKSLVRWIFWEIMVNRGLESGFFPVCWKEVWVVFLPKGGPAGWPAEYHPICLLNTTAKVVKRMLAVIDELKAGMDIHLNQYGFCKGKSDYPGDLKSDKLGCERKRGHMENEEYADDDFVRCKECIRLHTVGIHYGVAERERHY